MPYFVLVVSLLITLAATLFTEHASRVNERLRFQNLVQQTDDAIRARMDSYISILRGVSGLLASHPDINRDEFVRYVNRLKIAENYPGIQGVGIALVVPHENKDAWEKSVRAQGMPDFRIWPAVPPRSEYYPIMHLAPLDRRNLAAIGFDMRDEATRRLAMTRARDEGRPVASGRVTLVQEIDEEKQPGFLIYVPVYRSGGVPDSLAERRRQLWAFSYAPFRAHDLFKGIFGSQTQPRISFTLYAGDKVDPANLLYRSDPGVRPRFSKPSQTQTTTENIAGKTWTIVHETTPIFERTASDWTSFIPFVGLIISGVLFAISRSQASARAAAEETSHHLRESRRAVVENEVRQRQFLRDVLLGVTEGKLRLCHDRADLPGRLDAMYGPMELRRETLRDLREATRAAANGESLPADRQHDLITAVGEAAMNAIVHGHGGLAQVGVGAGNTVQVWIEDHGAGIDMHRLPRATLERGFTTADSLGHGFWLILQIVDRVWLLTGPKGTTVVLEQDPVAAEPTWLTANR